MSLVNVHVAARFNAKNVSVRRGNTTVTAAGRHLECLILRCTGHVTSRIMVICIEMRVCIYIYAYKYIIYIYMCNDMVVQYVYTMYIVRICISYAWQRITFCHWVHNHCPQELMRIHLLLWMASYVSQIKHVLKSYFTLNA